MAGKNGIYKGAHPSVKGAFADANTGSDMMFGHLVSSRKKKKTSRRKKKKN